MQAVPLSWPCMELCCCCTSRCTVDHLQAVGCSRHQQTSDSPFQRSFACCAADLNPARCLALSLASDIQQPASLQHWLACKHSLASVVLPNRS